MAKDAATGRILPGHRLSPATEIRPGQRLSPATEFVPGQRTSPATEFARGQAAHNKAQLGDVRVRVETHTGLSRAWVKIAEPNVWRKRAIVVWEACNGRALARGYVVHHKDRDSLNDHPDNLAALTRAEHVEEHRDELVLKQVAAIARRGTK